MPQRPETRARLLEAAARVIAEHGVADATTRRIADEAGVNLGTLHYWFTNKGELFGALLAAMEDQVRGGVTEQVQLDEDITTILLAAWDGLDAQMEAEQATIELRLHAMRNGMDGLARRQQIAYQQLAIDVTTAWRERNGIPAEGDDWEHLPELLVSVFDGLAISELMYPDRANAEGALRLFGRLLNLSLPPDPPA